MDVYLFISDKPKMGFETSTSVKMKIIVKECVCVWKERPKLDKLTKRSAINVYMNHQSTRKRIELWKYTHIHTILNSNLLNSLKNWPCVTSCLCRGIGKHTHTHTHTHMNDRNPTRQNTILSINKIISGKIGNLKILIFLFCGLCIKN